MIAEAWLWLGWLLAVPPLVALAIFVAEVAMGLAAARSEPAALSVPSRIAILIPAHNEAASIAATVAGLRDAAPAGTRILVVADNCTDQTAALARSAGAEVTERSHATLRGKGYALAHGRDVLALDPPEVVLIVDADCELTPGSVEQLAAATRSGVPAQAENLLLPDLTAPALVQISSFALLVKNLVRSRGMTRMGGCALLTGTGMAFPWPVFAAAPLATSDIAEDLGLTITLAGQGIRPRLVTQAGVRSRAASLRDSAAQRRRWEHGFLGNARKHALPTLWRGLTQPSRVLVALGLHLIVPPLALLFLAAGAIELVLLAGGALTQVWTPALGLAAGLVAAIVFTALAWLRFGRSTLAFAALLQAPLYVLWKIPTYIGFFKSRQVTWERTRRAGED
ncbi:glycosyltransferase family 2 protein [Novosphingobium piscinae]|uniref:Glycosyltransferase family 2 protein n=1 Tax=Novosphingobium piscinae TaxID=1507448 RepID=A0A7X1FWA9_9SPHN|nr:glycosyltransferase family 2 protein [Novosphingobium piscinae]MBC2668155.1 glycosyltransferase family 2 protein [Novosphingobium piscinae]